MLAFHESSKSCHQSQHKAVSCSGNAQKKCSTILDRPSDPSSRTPGLTPRRDLEPLLRTLFPLGSLTLECPRSVLDLSRLAAAEELQVEHQGRRRCHIRRQRYQVPLRSLLSASVSVVCTQSCPQIQAGPHVPSLPTGKVVYRDRIVRARQGQGRGLRRLGLHGVGHTLRWCK